MQECEVTLECGCHEKAAMCGPVFPRIGNWAYCIAHGYARVAQTNPAVLSMAPCHWAPTITATVFWDTLVGTWGYHIMGTLPDGTQFCTPFFIGYDNHLEALEDARYMYESGQCPVFA